MESRARARLIYWGSWALAGSYNLLRDVFQGPFTLLLVFNVTHFFIWGCLGCIAIPLIRRYPLRFHWQPWAFHLVAGALFTVTDITLGHWITYRVMGVGRELSFAAIAVVAFKNCFHLGLLTYWAMVGIVQGTDAQRRSRLREVQASRLEAQLAQAQLQALKMQIQPHFLFNTLNAIASFMHYDVKTADRMLTRLSDLLRLTLIQSERQEVSLRQELAFLEAYLEIEQIRFERRLSVEVDVPASLLEAHVPPFLLQPLVENAIKHSIAPRGAGGKLVIRAREEGNELRLEVEDDGPATLPAQTGFGIGLRNTRSRLDNLYGEGQHFELIRAGMGTIARVLMPLRPAGVSA